MVTGELKNKIDGLWDIFASGGLVNPLEVIEQITYLGYPVKIEMFNSTLPLCSGILLCTSGI